MIQQISVDTPNYQKGRYNGTSNFAELYTNLHLNKHIELLAGADYRQNKTDQAIYLCILIMVFRHYQFQETAQKQTSSAAMLLYF